MTFSDILGLRSLLKRIDRMLFKREDRELKHLVNSSDVENLAKVLETIPHGRKKTFALLDAERAAKVLKNLSPYLRQYVLVGIPRERVLAIMNYLESDEIADLIKILPKETRAAIVSDLAKSDPKKVLKLIKLRGDTAGGLMKTEMIVGKPEYTVKEFSEIMRENFPTSLPKTSYVYIVNDQGKLIGNFNFNRLYLADPQMKLQDLMRASVNWVIINQDQEEVAREFAAHDAIELPVVDDTGALVGRISADDIIDVLRTEFSEDISRLVGAFGDQRAGDPTRLKIKKRFPWLVINLATAILAAWVVSLFTDTISRFVILAAYMPIIAGMGGNAATQTLGVSIRAIALDEVNSLNAWKVIAKEIAAGTLNGFATGLLMGGLAYAFNHNLTLSFVIVAAMTFNLFVAGFGGATIPLIMKWMKIDPALASTVFVTTLTDVGGFFSFLGLATLLLK